VDANRPTGQTVHPKRRNRIACPIKSPSPTRGLGRTDDHLRDGIVTDPDGRRKFVVTEAIPPACRGEDAKTSVANRETLAIIERIAPVDQGFADVVPHLGLDPA